MANKRVISVNEASLVDLKAELFRKETQFKREKVDSSAPKKAPIWQRKKKESKTKKAEALEKATSDSSYDKELERSRLMLEAKSALYDKLSNGEIEVPSDEDEQEGRFLVDFHQKTIPKKNNNCYENENEGSIGSLSEVIPDEVHSDEEWVDYVDSFGRSRKCLRKDLPVMKEKDEKLKQITNQDTSLPTLLSDDMRREIIRKNWEKEVEQTLDKPMGPIHYQDVLFEETRDHGVGYYKFSTVEKERQEQQTTLNKLRTQTEQQRNKRQKLLEKRKAVMDARLEKLRQRKIRKLKEQGLAADDDDVETPVSEEVSKDTNIEHEEPTSPTKDESGISASDIEERIKNERARIEKSHLNKWEKSKIDLLLLDKPKPKAPIYDPQSDRNPEFAPPSSYTTNKTPGEKSKWKNVQKNSEENNMTNESLEIWKSQSESAITSTSLSLNCDSYPQENTSSTIIPQVPPVSCQPPIIGNILPNLPPPPTHAFPPPLHPPFVHQYSFAPPAIPSLLPTSGNFCTSNHSPVPPPPVVPQYPSVTPLTPNYPLSSDVRSTLTLPPGQLYHQTSPP